jgi:hypothetical protein
MINQSLRDLGKSIFNPGTLTKYINKVKEYDKSKRKSIFRSKDKIRFYFSLRLIAANFMIFMTSVL